MEHIRKASTGMNYISMSPSNINLKYFINIGTYLFTELSRS
jgi:hypothetical protein